MTREEQDAGSRQQEAMKTRGRWQEKNRRQEAGGRMQGAGGRGKKGGRETKINIFKVLANLPYLYRLVLIFLLKGQHQSRLYED